MRATPSGLFAQVDALIERLRGESLDGPASRLRELAHQVCWTTSSEMVGEIGLELLRIRRDHHLSAASRSLLARCLALVREVWPGISLSQQDRN